MAREFDQGNIPGSDVEMDGYLNPTTVPLPDKSWGDPGEKWLPKTDWSRDGIIASDD